MNKEFMKTYLFFCLTLLTAGQVVGQNLETYLHGGSSRQWELHSIVWNDNSRLESQEFGEGQGDEFTQENDEATTIPETIVFHADGTCLLVYVAHYNDTDGDEDEDLVDGAWELAGTWTVYGDNVQIVESNGYTWSLSGIQPHAEDEEFESGYDYAGFNSGIRSLGYYIDQ